MKLYMIRHGETDWNKTRQLQGKSDIPLNDFGRKLAAETAEALKDVPFHLVITSPLSRARETALIIKGDRVHYEPPAHGESFLEFCSRVERFLDELFRSEDYQDSTILLVVHGAVLCAMLRILKGNPMSMFWGSGVHKNCGVTVVNVQGNTWEIEQENVTYYEDAMEDW